MTAKETIELLLEDLKMSPNEFALAIGSSTSVIHNLTTGVTKKITSGTARKIIDAFPQYSYTDLINRENPIRSEKNLSEVNSEPSYSIKEKAIDFVENWETYKALKIISNLVDLEVSKTLLHFKENPKEYEKWLNNN